MIGLTALLVEGGGKSIEVPLLILHVQKKFCHWIGLLLLLHVRADQQCVHHPCEYYHF